MLCALTPAQAQSDTTAPAIMLNAPDGSTTFRAFPTPLVGTVYDAGGMGGLLAVQLLRNHSGAYQWWNGTSWGGYASWMASVTPAGTGGDYNWSADIPWPTGADSHRGSYLIAITAFDNAHNRSDIHRTVIIGEPDTTAPTINFVTPANGHLIDSSSETLEQIAGTVNDGAGSGVAYVEVSLARVWYDRAQLWDGTSWNGWRIFKATLGAPDATGERSWSVSGELPPREQLSTGQYLIDVSAYDYNGNRAFARHALHAAPRDTVAPTVDVTFPSQGQQLYALPEIRGTSADEGSGVSRVEVVLVRQTRQEDGSTLYVFWNGSVWGANALTLPSRLDTSWRRNQNLPSGADLPPGQYIVMCHVIDRYDNARAFYRSFSIVPVPPLSIDAHIRGDAAAVWLGEGFSNSDASGQTLDGTIAGGETQTRDIRIVRSGGTDSKSVRVTLPDWAAFAAAGWTASFTDARSAIDITAQITSADGWQMVMNDGDEKIIHATVTAPPSVTRGATRALTFRVEADPTSETPAIDVVKAMWTTTVATPDLAIRAGQGVWQGEGVYNADGAGQSVQRVIEPGQTVRNQIKLSVAEASAGQMVRWSVPDWEAFRADGWTAKFFDAPTGGNDITDQITGGNYLSQVGGGQQVVIGVEVSAPGGAAEAMRALSVRAELESGAADVVKMSLRVLPTVRPDVYISPIVFDNPGSYIGRDDYSPTPQVLNRVASVGAKEGFAVIIANSSNVAAQFLFRPLNLPKGWSYKLYDALNDGTLLDIENGEDAVTSLLQPSQYVIWRLEVNTGSFGDELEQTIPVHLSGGTQSDQCDIEMQLQGIKGAEYTLDAGATWTRAVGDEIIVPPGSTVGFNALKLNPEIPWPDDPFEPIWDHEGKKYYGELTFLYYPEPTPEDAVGETVKVVCGNDFTTQVRVQAKGQVTTPQEPGL